MITKTLVVMIIVMIMMTISNTKYVPHHVCRSEDLTRR